MENRARIPVLAVCATSIFSVLASTAAADLILSGVGTAGTIDFTGFTGSGLQPGGGGGTLDSNTFAVTGFSNGSTNFGDTQTTNDFARGSSTGGVTTGGIYAFDSGGGNVGLGVQPGGSDFTPGSIILRILNSTGQSVSLFDIAYDVLVYNDRNRANSFDVAWSTDNSTYTSLPALDLVSPDVEDLTPAWAATSRSATITTTIANGGNLYLRWTGDDVSGSGSRDEFALDNISVTAGVSTVPEPGSLTLLLCGIAGIAIPVVHHRRR